MRASSAESGDAARGADDPRFRRGVELFNAGEWFEAHEVWEDQWRGLRGDDRLLVQALIQGAVALLHFERGNLVGAKHLAAATLAKVSLLPCAAWGVDLEAFADAFEARLRPLFEPGATAGPPPKL